VSLATVLREWGRIGCIGFGGPPTHIKLLRELCVERRKWLDAREFEDAIAACNLLPGPASTQLAIFCAWRVSQRIEDALDAGTGNTDPPPHAKASGYTHRRYHPRPRPLYVREPVPGPAHSPRPPGPQHRTQTPTAAGVFADQTACKAISAEAGRCPDPAHA
jgi:hypothetical protein